MQVCKQKATLCVICATILGVGIPSAALTEVPAARIRVPGAEGQRAAAGWLRLESDQRMSREQADPLTLPDSRRLQVIEQQERARYREQIQTHERELRSLDRQERRLGHGAAQGLSPGARLQGRLIEQQRTQNALELRRHMDRRSQGSPPGRSLTR